MTYFRREQTWWIKTTKADEAERVLGHSAGVNCSIGRYRLEPLNNISACWSRISQGRNVTRLSSNGKCIFLRAAVSLHAHADLIWRRSVTGILTHPTGGQWPSRWTLPRILVMLCMEMGIFHTVKLNLKLKLNKASTRTRPWAILGVTCYMGSHNLPAGQCHPTQVNAPRLKLISWYSIYLARRDGRLSLPRLPGNIAPVGSRTRDLSITSPTPSHTIPSHKVMWRFLSIACLNKLSIQVKIFFHFFHCFPSVFFVCFCYRYGE